MRSIHDNIAGINFAPALGGKSFAVSGNGSHAPPEKAWIKRRNGDLFRLEIRQGFAQTV